MQLGHPRADVSPQPGRTAEHFGFIELIFVALTDAALANVMTTTIAQVSHTTPARGDGRRRRHPHSSNRESAPPAPPRPASAPTACRESGRR